MGYATYWAIAEIVLDRSEECGHCGRRFDIVQRVYGTRTTGHGTGIMSALTNAATRHANAANWGAHEKAMQRAFRAVPLHRCTHCGHYSDRAIELMREAFMVFRFRRRLLRWLLWLPGFAFAALYLLGILAQAGGSGDPGYRPAFTQVLGGLLFVLLVAAILWLAGWKVAFNLRSKYDARVRAANSPQRIARWLANWNSEGSRLTGKLLGSSTNAVQLRAFLWRRIRFLQHRYDTIPESWVIKARKDPLGALVARAMG